MINLFKVLKIASIIIIAYLLCIRLLLVFSYSTDLEGAEYVFVHYVQCLLLGKALYNNPVQFPFLSDIYTPGYPYLLYYIALFFRWNYINNIHQILVAARGISWLCMLVNIYFVYKCLLELKVMRNCILPLIALYLLLITGHFYAMRPDAIKSTLFTIIVFYSLRYVFSGGRIVYLLWLNMAVILTVLFKQDGIINIFLLAITLCVTVRQARSVMVLLSFGLSTILTLLVLDLVYGKYFFISIVTLNFQQNTDVLHSYNLLVMLFSALRLLPLFVIVIFGCFWSLRRAKGSGPVFYIQILAMVCFAVAHTSMLRAGSYLNYSFEPGLLLVLNLGIVLTDFKKALRKYLNLAVAAGALYVVLIFFSNRIIHSYSFNRQTEDNYKHQYFSLLEERTGLLAVIKDELMFFPNARYDIFYADRPLIFGYDMHMDRLIYLYLGLHITSRQVFLSSGSYDRYFETGQVPYVVIDNSERSINHIKKYYPHYKYYVSVNNFLVYRFAS